MQRMKRFFQKLTVGIVLRVVHAALVELKAQDTRVAEEFARMPEGLSYSIYTGHNGPVLHVIWQGGKLRLGSGIRRTRFYHGGGGCGCHALGAFGQHCGVLPVPQHH